MFKKLMILIFGDVYKELELCKEQVRYYKTRIIDLQLEVKKLKGDAVRKKIVKASKRNKKWS